MADKEKYMIKVGGKLVEVTPDVYYAYFRMERQERWQEEKQQGHAVVSYDALDDGETVGVEVVPDLTTPSMEEAVMTRCWRCMPRRDCGCICWDFSLRDGTFWELRCSAQWYRRGQRLLS